MVSFAAEVKKELTQLEVDHEHARAELAALLRMNGTIGILNQHLVLNVQTENAAIARRIYSLLKDFYYTNGEVIVRKKMKLKKNNIYIVRITHKAEEILKDMNILDTFVIEPHVSEDIMNNEQRRRSYLRGAFLAGGSVNNPETSSYHLEIYSSYEEHNEDIVEMMNHFGLNARMIERRSGYIAYLKESEKIADFLAIVGATTARFHFEDVRILRDARNSVNRVMNCDSANMDKTLDAAGKQLENILLIEDRMGLSDLPAKLQEVAIARLENPEVSLKELGEILPSGQISKSGINHRFRKINQIAEKLRGQATIKNS